jgi:hypothetical protein
MAFPERLALYLYAMHRDQAPVLLEALADTPRTRALAFMEDLKVVDSAQRQARLTREFGARPDALPRVEALLLTSAPPLRRAIVGCLPPALQAHFPHLHGGAGATAPAMMALAARLAREAVREPA